ncbi:protein kinase domain-containing protein [Streptomyces tauricus]|uniref:protein kinase domain-containing protein n=1 Tax=Streptomyces tauricus TaxID=68274 RepID=UPI001FE86A9E|nr:protein kinase [Streptomyces tauricus]
MGRYRLLGRLGSGGMGSVYLGRTPGGRPAAVKVINAHLQYDPAALQRFRREVETLGTIRNAFTAALIDAEVDSPPFWMATEYVPGPTLADAVAATGPFPVDLARAVLAALAEGLADVHVHGVLHRDIKPQNVILSATGPQLIDFGIARSDEMSNITQVGTAIGTPGFIAPESLTRGEAGPPSDVFALAVTLAYCLTGRAPYGEGALATVSYRTVHEEMDLAGVPAEMAELIALCAHKDPAQRPGPQRIVELCASETDIVRHPAYQQIIAMAPASDTAAAAAPPTPPAPPAPSAPYAPTRVDATAPTATVDAAALPGALPQSPVPSPAPAPATVAQTRFLPSPPPDGPGGTPPRGTRPVWRRRTPLIAAGAIVTVAVVVATAVALEGSGSTTGAKDPKASASRGDSHRSTADAKDPAASEKPTSPAPLPETLTVEPRRTLLTGEFLQTAHMKLVMQPDGNLVAYDVNDKATWASLTSGENYKAVFQEDGNLVVYTADDKPVWATNTGYPDGGAVLELRADGSFAVTKNGQDLFLSTKDTTEKG